MRIGLFLIAVILLLASQGRAGEQAGDHWRVVVQDAIPEPLAVSVDGKWIAARERSAQHIFHVLNRDASQIVLTVHLPQPIRGAAIADGGEWFAVSTEEHTYRVGRIDGSVKLLLEGVAGAVALDQSGQRLAVLGRLGEAGEARFSQFMGPAGLGVYDLEQGRWQSRVDTPILVGHVVTFDGNDVIAAGRAGRVFNRAASSFPCHIRLDLATGQTKTERGLETGPGARLRAEPNLPKGYTTPGAIQSMRQKLDAGVQTVKSMQERLSAGGPVRPDGHSVLTADDKQVLIVMDRGGKRSLLTIPADGDLAVRAVDVGYGLAYCDGWLLGRHGGPERDTIIDLQTGQDVFSVPRRSPSTRDGWVRFLPAGCLVREEARLKFYQPPKPKPIWERDVPEGLDNPYPLQSSPDQSRIALGLGGDAKNLIFVVSAQTGKTIAQIPRPDGTDHSGYALAGAFSRDGKRFVVVHQRSLRVHEVGTGQVRYERELAKKEYLWSATGVGNGWLLGANDHSLFLDAEQKTEIKIPLGRIDKAVPLPQTDRQPFLVETSVGLGGIVTRDGKVLRSWRNEEIGSVRDSNSPPLSGVAFGGRLVARLTGSPAVELIDARTLEPIAHIHILKLSEGWGWIVHTPDGYWDSSPGAERFVAVFQNGRQVQPAESKSRRPAGLLKTRLPR